MLVYGDPQFRQGFTSCRSELLERLRKTDPTDLDDLRAALIQTGQFEQGISDLHQSKANPNPLEQVCRATDQLAAAFYRLWSQSAEHQAQRSFIKARLEKAAFAVAATDISGDPLLTIKIPE